MLPSQIELIRLCDANGNAARGLIDLLNKSFDAARDEPPPKPGQVNIGELVIADMQARTEHGYEQYGTLLQSHNGRDALMDAYQEALDLCMYLRQAIEERDE